MEQEGLSPNEEADKERLLKRVCLDLTGLPPGLDMMDKFLADKSEGALKKSLTNFCKHGNTAKKWRCIGLIYHDMQTAMDTRMTISDAMALARLGNTCIQ